ncbi:RHS repeat domain-containing protein, partial [Bacteroides congonensis]
CLNLPSRIEFENGNSISFLYAADGTKLRITHVIGKDITITDYCGNVIYENGVPKLLLTETGYVSLNDNKYHYFIQDHQGNNRMVADEDGTLEEVNDYYPFGGLMASSVGSVQPYKYNGKELDRKGGLDWYDYGARMYDAALGRWHTVDPMAEKYYSLSPYAYCAGNPLKYVDLKGDSISIADLYTRDKQGELINPNQVEVFEFLINTKEGKALLGNYAAKGQTIAGVSFDKDGKFHRQGINISFGANVRDSSVSGTTTFSLDDKNLNIQVAVGSSSDKPDLLDTFVHEIAIHADQNAVDFIDDKKMNNSNAYPALRKMNAKRGYTQHWQERNVNRAMERIGVPVMQQYYKSKGVSKPKSAILKSVYGFIN